MPEILVPMLSIGLPPHDVKKRLSSTKSQNSVSAQPTTLYLWEENTGLKNNETESSILTLDYINSNFSWSEKTSCYLSNTGCVGMYV